jgi:cell shape-determining protein MreC
MMGHWWRHCRRERHLLGIFFALLLGWLLIPPIFRRQLCSVLQELQAPIWYATAVGQDICAREVLLAQPKETLARLVVELSRQNAHQRLLAQVRTNGVQHDESQLSGRIGDFTVQPLRVLRRDGKAWWQELLVGGGSGLRENMPLVCGEFLAGKILHVHRGHCVALLASDPRFRIVAHVARDRRPVIYEGVAQGGFGQPIGRVTNLPKDLGDGSPLTIVTSSLSGTYPDGIPIGTVGQLRPSLDGLFLEGTVLLSPLLLQTRELGVLVPCSATMPP